MSDQKVEPKAIVATKADSHLPFVPTNVTEAWRTSEMLANSNILPDALKGKTADIMVVLLTGAELGLSPMQAIRDVVVVKGKGYIGALLKVALVKQSPVCEYFRMTKSDATIATFETKRKGEGVTVMSFTIEEAKRANLSGDNWSKYPAVMLRRRAASQLADEVYPDVVRGIAAADDLPEAWLERVEEAPKSFVQTVTGETVAPPPPPSTPPKAKKVDKKIAVEDLSTPEKKVEAPAEPPPPTDADAPREPGSDDVVPEKAGPTSRKDQADAEAIALALETASTTEEIDWLAKKAKSLNIQGPPRDMLATAFKERRAQVA